MPGVTIRSARESSTVPIGYETLVEADSDNTKVETQSKISFFRKERRFLAGIAIFLLKKLMNQLKVIYSFKVQLYLKNIGENEMKLVLHIQSMVVSSKLVMSVVMIQSKMFSLFVVDNQWISLNVLVIKSPL